MSHPMLNIAIRAARHAGKYISRAFEDLDRVQIESKGLNDYVSQVDRQAEALVLEVLKDKYPKHHYIAEESGISGDENSDYQWIIDPLDGTTNFLHGFPQFAISIALKHKGQLDQAIILDPIRNEEFTASRGRGAQMNGRRLRVSKQYQLEGSLLGTGMPFRPDQQDMAEAYWAILKDLAGASAGIRRPGAAALDLAYVAAGRLDGFWEFGLKSWDMAAGILLIREAGGMVVDPLGGDNFFESGNVVCGNNKILKLLLQHIRPKLQAQLE
ncbi:MAG: inositol monophosphatase family protein [Pseudomonadota bacterium]